MMADHPTDQELADVIERSAQANAALMHGDIKRYRDLLDTGPMGLPRPTTAFARSVSPLSC